MFQIQKEKVVKFITIIIIFTLLTLYRNIRQEQQLPTQSQCIIDKAHELLRYANRKMAESSFWKAVLIGFGQVIVDGTGVAASLIWSFDGYSGLRKLKTSDCLPLLGSFLQSGPCF